MFSKLSPKYPTKDIKAIIEDLELLGYIAYDLNSQGEEILKLTPFGKERLAIFKGATFFDKVINWVIYNPIVRKALGL